MGTAVIHSPDAMKRATLTGSGPPRQMSPLVQQRGLAKASRSGDQRQITVESHIQPLNQA
jgi:hypothetical protein